MPSEEENFASGLSKKVSEKLGGNKPSKSEEYANTAKEQAGFSEKDAAEKEGEAADVEKQTARKEGRAFDEQTKETKQEEDLNSLSKEELIERMNADKERIKQEKKEEEASAAKKSYFNSMKAKGKSLAGGIASGAAANAAGVGGAVKGVMQTGINAGLSWLPSNTWDLFIILSVFIHFTLDVWSFKGTTTVETVGIDIIFFARLELIPLLTVHLNITCIVSIVILISSFEKFYWILNSFFPIFRICFFRIWS